MRLDKFLVNMGFGSRKKIKALAKAKQIIVNGQLIKKTDIHIDAEHDNVELAGKKVSYKPFIYIMLHKPAGYISATEDQQHQTVLDLIKEADKVLEPFPVGRLDKDTEGLLLLTNDGQLAHHLLAPKKKINKKYIASLAKPITDHDIQWFKKGVTLDDGYVTKPAVLRELDNKLVEVTIIEGKYHQVKRMFKAINNEVLYLKREAMGTLELDQALKPGNYRELTQEELDQLKFK